MVGYVLSAGWSVVMPESPFDSLVEAFRDAKAQMTDSARAVRSDIVSPADPNATRLTRQERLADFEDFMVNPARRESEFLRLRDRYNLPEDKPIPRRLVQFVLEGLKEQRKASKD